MKFDHNERCRRMIKYAGDIFDIRTVPQARKWWKKVNTRAKELEDNVKNEQKKADKALRDYKKTPSRSYVGKHDKQVRELEL